MTIYAAARISRPRLFRAALWAAGIAGSLVLHNGPARSGDAGISPFEDPGYKRCVTGMMEGFTNGLDEGWCAGNYALPSAFHFKCLRQLSVGFESPLDRAACINYFREAALRAENQSIR